MISFILSLAIAKFIISSSYSSTGKVFFAGHLVAALDGGMSTPISTKKALTKQENNIDALLFESAGAFDTPVATNDLDCGLVNEVHFYS